MQRFTKIALACTALAGLAGTAFAEGHMAPEVARAIEARQAHMTLYAYNLGPLGGMAQDKMPYDAEMAAAHAANLASLAAMTQTSYWPQDSDGEMFEETKALPAIWEDADGFAAAEQALVEATAALAEAAGTDLDALRAAFGPVGQACGACHRTYRARDDG